MYSSIKKYPLALIARITILVVALFSGVLVFAQDKGVNTKTVDEVMRSNNKIYVVMAVCLTILIGFILYTIRVDRKIKKIEDSDIRS